MANDPTDPIMLTRGDLARIEAERDADRADVARLTGERDDLRALLSIERTTNDCHVKVIEQTEAERDAARAEADRLRGVIGEMRERLAHVFESPCPNGDEDCGEPLCMYCGKLIEQAIASADAALNLLPCGHPKTAVIGRTSQFCGACERAAKAKQV